MLCQYCPVQVRIGKDAIWDVVDELACWFHASDVGLEILAVLLSFFEAAHVEVETGGDY